MSRSRKEATSPGSKGLFTSLKTLIKNAGSDSSAKPHKDDVYTTKQRPTKTLPTKPYTDYSNSGEPRSAVQHKDDSVSEQQEDAHTPPTRPYRNDDPSAVSGGKTDDIWSMAEDIDKLRTPSKKQARQSAKKEKSFFEYDGIYYIPLPEDGDTVDPVKWFEGEPEGFLSRLISVFSGKKTSKGVLDVLEKIYEEQKSGIFQNQIVALFPEGTYSRIDEDYRDGGITAFEQAWSRLFAEFCRKKKKLNPDLHTVPDRIPKICIRQYGETIHLAGHKHPFIAPQAPFGDEGIHLVVLENINPSLEGYHQTGGVEINLYCRTSSGEVSDLKKVEVLLPDERQINLGSRPQDNVSLPVFKDDYFIVYQRDNPLRRVIQYREEFKGKYHREKGVFNSNSKTFTKDMKAAGYEALRFTSLKNDKEFFVIYFSPIAEVTIEEIGISGYESTEANAIEKPNLQLIGLTLPDFEEIEDYHLFWDLYGEIESGDKNSQFKIIKTDHNFRAFDGADESLLGETRLNLGGMEIMPAALCGKDFPHKYQLLFARPKSLCAANDLISIGRDSKLNGALPADLIRNDSGNGIERGLCSGMQLIVRSNNDSQQIDLINESTSLPVFCLPKGEDRWLKLPHEHSISGSWSELTLIVGYYLLRFQSKFEEELPVSDMATSIIENRESDDNISDDTGENGSAESSETAVKAEEKKDSDSPETPQTANSGNDSMFAPHLQAIKLTPKGMLLGFMEDVPPSGVPIAGYRVLINAEGRHVLDDSPVAFFIEVKQERQLFLGAEQDIEIIGIGTLKKGDRRKIPIETKVYSIKTAKRLFDVLVFVSKQLAEACSRSIGIEISGFGPTHLIKDQQLVGRKSPSTILLPNDEEGMEIDYLPGKADVIFSPNKWFIHGKVAKLERLHDNSLQVTDANLDNKYEGISPLFSRKLAEEKALKRIEKTEILFPGDEIIIGNYIFNIEIEESVKKDS